jgi:FkbM family methyltransferase
LTRPAINARFDAVGATSLGAKHMTGQFIDYCGAKLFVPEGHFAEKNLLEGAVIEGHVARIFSELIRPGHVVIDIGANIGFHSFRIAQLVGPNGKVYAVEADIDNAIHIRKSILESENTNIYLLPVAAGDCFGLLNMLATKGTNSSFSPNARQSNRLAVKVKIDDIISERVNFIKMDIEGAELLALLGLQSILENSRPFVTSEFSSNYIKYSLGKDRALEFLNFFFSRGFSCFQLRSKDILSIPDAEAVLELSIWLREEHMAGHIDLLFVPLGTSIDGLCRISQYARMASA